MSEALADFQELAAWKAIQERNRDRRLREIYTPAERWRRQQEALETLSRLRPAGSVRGRRPGEAKAPSPTPAG